jgi:acyl-CoA synthetase (NDP forming)
VAPVADSAGKGALAAFLVPDAPEAWRRLTEAGVAAFRNPETCADVVAAALSRRSPVARKFPHTGAPDRPVRTLDEADAYRVFAEVGVPVAEHAVVDIGDGAGDISLPFGYPVAVKVLDADLPHKSDVGGVVLKVPDPAGLAEAVHTIVANVARHRPGKPVTRVLVQPMVTGLGEVLVGYRVDPQVGPLVVLAAGGTLTELYRDRAVRLAPVTGQTAREMLDEVVALRVLRGYRGAPPGDLEAVADAVSAVSRLAQHPHIAEAEINPLLVHGEAAGVQAVDALVRVLEESPTAGREDQ